MKIEAFGADKLEFFKSLFEEARVYAEATNEELKRNMEQYKGSAQIDNSSVPASQVRNVTYELVESQITSYIPTPQVSAIMQSDKNERNAKCIETLLRNKRDELPFEKLNDIDERYNPIYGGSVWLVEWDNSIKTHNSVGDVRVSCLSPQKFVGQPYIYEVSDMEYCFLVFETTKEDIVRRYGVSRRTAANAESDESSYDRTATLYVCYYKDDEGRVCQYVWSGDTELVDIENYYARKRRVCRLCGKRSELCSCSEPRFELVNESFETLDRDVPLNGGGAIPARSGVIENGCPVFETVTRQALDENGEPAFEALPTGGYIPLLVEVEEPKTEPTRLPFYAPSVFPIVIRKNTSEENSYLGQSDCEFIRPQQQAINKLESRILEKLIKAGVIPIVPEDFRGELNNSVFGTVFRCAPDNFNRFGRVDLQVDISRDIQQSERLYDQAKRILGISDSFQGQHDASAQSGRAKLLQIQQAAGRLDSKRQMKNAAYADIYKIIFQYYLAYADEPRPAVYRDADGRLQNYSFNRYDFIERDESGEYYYNDEYLFKTDSTVDVDQSRELLWQENRQNLQSGAYGDPQKASTRLIFWQNMERTHYPFAGDNVARIKAEISAAEAERAAALGSEERTEPREGFGGAPTAAKQAL